MKNSYRNEWVKTVTVKTAPATITVTFAGHAPAIYSKSMLPLFKTDPAVIDIMDTQTGEILYINRK